LTALTVAIVSAVALAAYDKPLDRQALTPSVVEFIDPQSVQPVNVPAADVPNAHAMLLRYDFIATPDALLNWHRDGTSTPVARIGQPELL